MTGLAILAARSTLIEMEHMPGLQLLMVAPQDPGQARRVAERLRADLACGSTEGIADALRVVAEHTEGLYDTVRGTPKHILTPEDGGRPITFDRPDFAAAIGYPERGELSPTWRCALLFERSPDHDDNGAALVGFVLRFIDFLEEDSP